MIDAGKKLPYCPCAEDEKIWAILAHPVCEGGRDDDD